MIWVESPGTLIRKIFAMKREFDIGERELKTKLGKNLVKTKFMDLISQ